VSPIRRLARNRRAVAVFEYALIASMIAVAVAIVVTSVDINVDGIVATIDRMFSTVADQV
jgi:Flp pilus assembly pilin Flp